MENNTENDISLNIETKLSKDKRMECRNIVQTVKEFGVSQRQMLYIIQLFALELEDREVMTSIINAVKANREKIQENIIEVSSGGIDFV